jgi:hypothetical protein
MWLVDSEDRFSAIFVIIVTVELVIYFFLPILANSSRNVPAL